jgi:hypothetical protein
MFVVTGELSTLERTGVFWWWVLMRGHRGIKNKKALRCNKAAVLASEIGEHYSRHEIAA